MALQGGVALVLPQAAVQHVHLVRQQRNSVERGDGAAVADLGLRNPAEVAEFPQFDLCSREVGQNDAVQINGLCKPLSEVLLHTVALPLCCLEKVWLQF